MLADLEMKLIAVGTAGAYFGDLLPRLGLAALSEQQSAVVRVRRQEDVVVLDNYQVPVPNDTGTAIDNNTVRRRDDRFPSFARQVDTLVDISRIREFPDEGTTCRPNPRYVYRFR